MTIPGLKHLITILENVLLLKKAQRYGSDHVFLDLTSTPDQWMNLGHWTALKPTSDFVQACQAAARSLANAVGLSKSQTVVDVGFGCGDQDFFFIKEYGVGEITGYNASRDQVEIAKARCAKLGETRFNPRFGIAPHLDVLPASADVVLSLDSAYHYNTREEFVSRSLNWLKPGGKLGLVDLILNDTPTTLQWLILLPFSKMIGIPMSNLVDAKAYANMMEQSGYEHVKLETLDDSAFSHLPTFIDHQLRRYDSILNPLLILKYTFISQGMRLLAKLKLFRLVVAVGSRPNPGISAPKARKMAGISAESEIVGNAQM